MTLSATRVKALKDPGRYSDGGGLHLYISKAGRKSWVLRITVDGRRRDIGLGGYPSVSLARAREKAADNRAAIADGRDPVAEKHAPSIPTFREAAYAVHEANKPRWRNARHIAGWMQALERHAMPALGNKPLNRIDRGDVLQVLTPIWTTRPETARRVRQRMRTVFKWAISYGFMESNPAGEAVDGALPTMPKVKAHFRALPYQEVGAALETVAASQASMSAKLCFRFLVLTAARSGEARGAIWDEIDLQDQVWRIPSERMKAGMEHRIPLSGQALDLLGEASVLREDTGLVFPSPLKRGAHVRHDTDEDAPFRRSGGTCHCPRVPQQFQELDTGTNGHPVGCFRSGSCPQPRQCDRAGLRQVRSIRAAPHADAPVGRLPDRLISRNQNSHSEHRLRL